MSVAPNTASELVHSIFDLNRAIRVVVANADSTADLGIAVEGVLRLVGEKSECRATDIACSLGIGASALSRHVADLAELGMIERRPDPADGRAQLLALSQAGQDYLAATGRRRAATLERMLAGWSEAEAAAATAIIAKLSTVFRTTPAAQPGTTITTTLDTAVSAGAAS
ncbi:MarR family winged helix-turn-helix transcriptional regulator [Arthrobacter sp. 35W]|uniref:MarR family winged helix-turn-helix transcriptional regulator n=1 Tax=Arthrobacter sp. 35W TaxID=1132441 RepID=UPI000412EBC8|nr:MarR family winged helix-turn-helix transcriptional regulator [Arthrobacter sp. 35W]